MKFSIFIACILFITSPMLSNYVFLGPLSIGDVSLLISLILFIKMIEVSRFLITNLMMCIGVILISIFLFLSGGDVPKSFFRASFFLIILPFFLSLSDKCYCSILNIYLKVSFFVSMLLVFQLFFYYLLNINFSMQLPIPVFEVDTLDIIDPRYAGFRAASVFKEPSYFAIFIVPALIYYARENSLKNYIFYFVILVFSTSSLGIAFSILSLFVFISKSSYNKNNLIIVLTLFPLFIAGFIIFMLFTENIAILRFFELSQGGGSLEVRLFNMFNIVNEFSLFVNYEFSKEILMLNSKDIWYNSFVYLVANFGLIFLLPLLFIGLRVGFFVFCCVMILLFLTHSFSNSFFTVFLILCYYIVNLDFLNKDPKINLI